MNLYIQINDGQPVNHPVLMDNLVSSLGCIPNDWEQFIRIPCPQLGPYQVLESETPTYQKQFGYWMDVWAIRDMTAEEKTAKQQAVIDAFRSREQAENWAAWNLNETTCMMEPPISRPVVPEGTTVFWCGAENNWKEAPSYPVDGNDYKFDFLAWQWVQVVN
jgi:hypothetical protein